MLRTPSRAVGALTLGVGALALSGCAVIGGDAGTAGVVSDADLSSTYGLVSPGTLTVCSDIPYPPFEFEQDGELTGYDIDLVEAVAEELGLGLNVIDSSFEAIESGASLTGCDLNASSISITEARQRVMAFTLPYLDDDLVLVAKKGSGITNIDSAKGRRIGVQAATTGDEYAQQNGLSPVQFEDGGMQIQALQAGTVDAALGNQSVLLYSLKDDARFEVVESLPTGEQLGMAVGPHKAQLGSAVNRALQGLRNDGTVAELQERWFGQAQEDYR
ncbi:ABC transporter substrate-binding protein [Micrococcus sp. EYE_162]|uniref:ABC transporter substrate-binding protein n=1 Tax=unclassified Micrococcus TaxID=2620948 RepID=UPI00200647EC|nr:MULTISPECIES: ABC transporter substrate-binding protein [unclassified Micrococcus]MCK6095363.1 ABC transporter substrate-binding protein [Micrococcus sp. EYE_212]MCK6171365.1 ABC transporter substrate-binding protein [Micrococcus sp. EYE_162]